MTVKGATPEHVSAPVARTVNENVPTFVGVPATTPDVLRLRPSGSVPVPIVNWYGAVPPVAVSVCEYGVPTTPPGSAPLMVIAGQTDVTMSASVRGKQLIAAVERRRRIELADDAGD